MKKLTLEEFVEKSKIIFKNKLDYSKANYINSRIDIILICKLHGEFRIKPKDHLSYKRGCSICSGVKYNTQTFKEAATLLHNDKYIYDKINYTGIKVPVIIICRTHGDFLQSPDKHLNGKNGCPKCKKNARRDINYVIDKANKVHRSFYDYSLSQFTRMFDKILIICPFHGEFMQTPANHINHKQRCPICTVGKSKKEEWWLDQLNIPYDNIHRSVILKIGPNKRLIVDGFDPSTNTIYEFYGDFWYGNPKVYAPSMINEANHISFGRLYEKTLEREKFLIDYGYKIISVWENDFDKTIKQRQER